MDAAFRHCTEQVRSADKDRFLATLFAPAGARGPLYALYAFAIEIARVRDRITSPLPGEVRLQWWRDALSEARTGEAAANPVAASMLEAVRQFDLPVAGLLELIDAHTFDLYDEPMASLDAFEQYAQATSGTVIRLAATILNSGAAPELADADCHAAMAATIAAVLQQLPRHAARGQCYVPADVLSRHGATAADLVQRRDAAGLRASLAEMRAIARRHLAELASVLPGISGAVLPAFLALAPVPAVLARMERGGDPYRPAEIPQWRRQWLLWRAARNPRRIAGLP